MPIRILATLLALALTSTVSLTAPAAETTDYIAQIKQQQGKAETGDASAAQDPLVAQTLNRHYPVNADASERLARISDGAQHECHYIRPDDKNEYCMSLHSEKTVATARGKRRYLLFRGDNLSGAHAASGLVALHAVTAENGAWRETARVQSEVGELGRAPEAWQWQELGAGYWGVSGQGSFTANGETTGGMTLLYDGGDRLAESYIPVTLSWNADFCDPAVAAFCDNDWKDENRAKEVLAHSTDLHGILNIRRDLAPSGNLWPLEIRISGFKGRKITGRENNGAYRIAPIKEYWQDKYLFRYDAAKHAYHMPDDYPLNIQY